MTLASSNANGRTLKTKTTTTDEINNIHLSIFLRKPNLQRNILNNPFKQKTNMLNLCINFRFAHLT